MGGATPKLLRKFSSFGDFGIGINIALIYLFVFTLNDELSGQWQWTFRNSFTFESQMRFPLSKTFFRDT